MISVPGGTVSSKVAGPRRGLARLRRKRNSWRFPPRSRNTAFSMSQVPWSISSRMWLNSLSFFGVSLSCSRSFRSGGKSPASTRYSSSIRARPVRRVNIAESFSSGVRA